MKKNAMLLKKKDKRSQVQESLEDEVVEMQNDDANGVKNDNRMDESDKED